jgi:hypothetical protein
MSCVFAATGHPQDPQKRTPTLNVLNLSADGKELALVQSLDLPEGVCSSDRTACLLLIDEVPLPLASSFFASTPPVHGVLSSSLVVLHRIGDAHDGN